MATKTQIHPSINKDHNVKTDPWQEYAGVTLSQDLNMTHAHTKKQLTEKFNMFHNLPFLQLQIQKKNGEIISTLLVLGPDDV